MISRRPMLVPRLALALGAAVCVAWLAQLDHTERISTDVLDLMPADERDPDLALVRSIASERQGRVALFVLEVEGAPPGALERAGQAFAAALVESGAFRTALDPAGPGSREAVGRWVFERRFDLLLPEWLAAREQEHAGAGGPWAPWLAERVVDGLDEFLTRPEAAAFEPLLPADPLLLVPDLVEGMQGVAGLDPGVEAPGRVRIWAEAAAPPLRDEGQGPVFQAVEQAWERARAIVPGVDLRWTAVSRFAAESRRRIESEIKFLNTGAVTAVVLVLVLALRRAWQVVHLLPVIGCSLLGAWTVTTLVFDRVHILVFVIGSLLGGVAVDYGLHVFLHRAGPGESRWRGVCRPLAGSAATSLVGFALLAGSDLPLLRQTGVFVCAGIVTAVLAALAWFSGPAATGATRLEGRMSLPAMRGLPGATLFAGLAALAAAGLLRLGWHDDIRELEIRSPELWSNDAAVRARFGDAPGRALWITRGADIAEARAALARLQAWLGETAPEARLASVGLVLPTRDAYERLPERLASLAEFPETLAATLDRRGYEAAAFGPFFQAWQTLASRQSGLAASRERAGYDALAGEFSSALPGPAALALDTRPGAAWFAVVVDDAPATTPPVGSATVPVTQLQTLNDLFSRYRMSALRLSLLGLGGAAVCVVAVFGARAGLRMSLVPAGACLLVFGVFGLLGHTLNLFHLLGAFLAVCLTIDYAIFAVDGERRGGGVPPSVRLSALTTAASFGVLGFSAIPVVSALGITVALIVATGWALVEMLASIRSGQGRSLGV